MLGTPRRREANLDVGSDTGTPVDDRDDPIPFAFTGKVDRMTLTIDRPELSPAVAKKPMEARRPNRVSGYRRPDPRRYCAAWSCAP